MDKEIGNTRKRSLCDMVVCPTCNGSGQLPAPEARKRRRLEYEPAGGKTVGVELPPEVWEQILMLVETEMLVVCLHVCKTWSSILRRPPNWIDTRYRPFSPTRMTNYCINGGYVSLLRWTYAYGGYVKLSTFGDEKLYSSRDALITAARNGHVGMFDLLFRHQARAVPTDIVEGVIKNGQIQLLEYFKSLGRDCNWPTANAMRYAVMKAKSLPVFKWLLDSEILKLTPDLFVYVIQRGCLPMLKYLLDRSPPGAPPTTAHFRADMGETAARSGRVEILRYLETRFAFTLPYDVLDSVIAFGELPMVRYLCTEHKGKEQFRLASMDAEQRKKAIKWAVKYKCYEILEFLLTTMI